MKRPDQDRFDMLARHFESIDEQLASFCKDRNFKLEKNVLRQPNRVLRRQGNPECLIDISLSEHWLKESVSDEMLHTVTAIVYYEPPNGIYVWRIAQEVSSQERYSLLQEKLSKHLEAAFRLINEWTPEVVMQNGQRSENLKHKYGAT